MRTILIFAHKANGTGPKLIHLEDVRYISVAYAAAEPLSETLLRRRIEERLRQYYCQVIDVAGKKVPSRQVVESVMREALDRSWVFWSDLASDVVVGAEVAMAMQHLKSIKDVEAILKEEHGWIF